MDALPGVAKAHDESFGPPADSSGDVEGRRTGMVTGDRPVEQDTVLLLDPVHVAGDLAHTGGVDGLERVVIARERFGNREQVALNHLGKRCGLVVRGERPRQADLRDELVNGAVGLDTGVTLGDPSAPDEAGLAGVACLRGDAHSSPP